VQRGAVEFEGGVGASFRAENETPAEVKTGEDGQATP